MGTIEKVIIEAIEKLKSADKKAQYIVIGRAYYKKLCMSNISMSGDTSIDGVLFSFQNIPLVVISEKKFLEVVPRPDLTYLEN